MANCPNCGSNHIQLQRETNVNWGRAAAGWALFGVVGGAVGAVTGEDRNVNACLDCGTTWRAADLYKTLEIIKHLTQEILDLSLARDRLYLNDFMVEIGPYLDSISKAEEEGNKMIKEAESKKGQAAASGCGTGCLMSIFVACGGGLAVTVPMSLIVFTGIFISFLCFLIGASIDAANSKVTEEEIQGAIKKAEKIKQEADIDFNYRIKDFIARHSIN
ncbi:hypothetical protein NIES3806_18960 [Microcystis aeruginosa NIES-3806]|uniref:Uncharacterized protein n=2 Tax=Microcystis aeruginosa TaxID=1126 RepID=A0A0F6U7S8_MICAE|nr:hypothetical protein [Microcystis aeruginosa]AKE66227.1 hypothetical protein MYAER_3897 [Microcystis aeruginosa NIES-2549]AOC54636.1 hypothetical protein amyaer_3943 [Microcystis aeruginosa NIES-2481]GCL45360.1 hypothetical protein NIES3787_10430 [Microcystis aeruginosa NIES-3787]GCL54553.1 hypothetical protein NIES3806_18960 [Microcystis aeruginosa NIES-3806]